MSERWISQCRQIIQTLTELEVKREKDQLERINALLFTISTLHRSIEGWRNWVQNLRFMSKFTVEELAELEHDLIEHTRAFIEHDIEVSEKYAAKIPIAKYSLRTERATEDRSGLYA